jgi:hypothetical protein
MTSQKTLHGFQSLSREHEPFQSLGPKPCLCNVAKEEHNKRTQLVRPLLSMKALRETPEV